MLSRRTLAKIGMGAAMCAGLIVLAEVSLEQWALGPTDGAGWQPMRWPLRDDAWPRGRAWHRHGTEVYVRVKPGYCGDCEAGIIGDEALDRAVDIELVDERYTARGPGARIRVTDLFGRTRIYSRPSWFGERLAQGIAVTHKCDLIVAIVVGDVGDAETAKSAHRFIESNTVQVWLIKQLGE
jgi:hypothetical protein